MKKYYIAFTILVLLLGCGRVGNEDTILDSYGGVIDSGDILFELKSKSQLVDENGNSYIDKGHYTLLVQSKNRDNTPIGDLKNIEYKMYENNLKTPSSEARVNVDRDSRLTTNNILLLLDFSGSLIDDCDRVDSVLQKDSNLCYQLVESAKDFIDTTISTKQTIAIYYFDSKSTITPLVTSNTASTTDDILKLKNGLDQLYDPSFRRENLQGFSSTNLNGAVIEATKVACQWVGNCNYDNYKPQNSTNLEHFEFASIVVFTDGKDTANRVSKSSMINFIEMHKEIYYYSIGLGNVDKQTLVSIGKDKYIPVSQNSELDNAFDDLSQELEAWGNSFYKVDYCPASQQGAVDIRIQVTSENRSGVIHDSIRLPENVDFRCDLL